MKGYWLILGSAIHDQAAHDEYNRLWAPIAKKYHARVNPDDLAIALKEQRDTQRLIVVEFPSYEAATACYDDPDYQTAMRHAHKGSQRDLVILALPGD
ncbi:DUF1330 domain-containing protein [Acuticoccus yangtzensis]|uniref:DUF1330 domain-containing protein n=1 Tax=Acuticoccus yangtzensis TaxID=1443441 RepID=UPI00094964A4|nr:DUF1330 domain-containing protein [Acuticoccus yangtzensis]